MQFMIVVQYIQSLPKETHEKYGNFLVYDDRKIRISILPQDYSQIKQSKMISPALCSCR
jgi:hypothetical protein